MAMIVNGFIEPFTKELPMECAVELNRLIQLQMKARSASFERGGTLAQQEVACPGAGL